MPEKILYSIIESASHPPLQALYKRLGYKEVVFTSVRKAIQALKRTPPDAVVADFLYGYGNNYAGVNISNLDVFIYSTEKYAPACRIVALYEKSEQAYIDRFSALFPAVSCLMLPVSDEQVQGELADAS